VNAANAGVIGVLFGAGQYGQDTEVYDYAGDGITNPNPINGNTNVALYADDDGGFLRTGAAAYYTNPILWASPLSWMKSGNQLSLEWSNGAGVLLASTNLALPGTNWTRVATNPVMPYAVGVSNGVPRMFYRAR
jgi:hypothetical protein